MSVDHLNYLLLEEVFSGESFCWFSQSVSCVVAKSLNGDLYSCARGMILQTENSLLHSLSRPDLLFVIFNSVMTVLNDVTTKYRLMREEAAYANHNVVVWYLLECRCSLLDERRPFLQPQVDCGLLFKAKLGGPPQCHQSRVYQTQYVSSGSA